MGKRTSSWHHDGSNWINRVQHDSDNGSSVYHDYREGVTEISGVYTNSDGDQYKTYKGSDCPKEYIGNDGRHK